MIRKLKSSAAFWFVLIMGVLYIAGGVMAQLQQSGGPGSAVTLNAGANLAGKFGIDQTTPGTTNAVSLAQIGGTTAASGNGVSGAGVQRVAIASDNTAFSVNAAISAAIPTGSNVIGVVNTIPKTACGNAVASQTLIAVPQVSTAVFTSTTCLVEIIMNNTTNGALTITVSDNIGTPINDLLTFSIPPFSQIIQPLYGQSFSCQ